jgi:hypothetical protein
MTQAWSPGMPVGLDGALVAARRGDLPVLHASVDWRLSEAPILASSAGRGVPGTGYRSLEQGVALERDATDWRAATDLVTSIGQKFAPCRDARPATEAETAETLAVIRIADLPDDAPAELREYFDRLRPEAALIREVWIVQGEAGDLPVAVAPTSGQLVLPLDTDVYQ